MNYSYKTCTQCSLPLLEGCNNLEATPLESLPGHKAFTKQNGLETQSNTNDKYFNKIDSMMPVSKISQLDIPSSITNMQPGKLFS